MMTTNASSASGVVRFGCVSKPGQLSGAVYAKCAVADGGRHAQLGSASLAGVASDLLLAA